MMFCAILFSEGRIFAQNWPGWRGDGRGISPEKNLPLKWSEQDGIKWKTPIPGAGHSSPIVCSDRIFVTTAVAGDPNVETFRGGVYMGGNLTAQSWRTPRHSNERRWRKPGKN